MKKKFWTDFYTLTKMITICDRCHIKKAIKKVKREIGIELTEEQVQKLRERRFEVKF